MKSLFSLPLFLLPFFTAAQQLFNEPAGKTYAVVIGISDYEHPRITDLKFAHRDAEAFVEYLKSAAGGKLPDEQMQVLLNEKANRGAIYAAFYWLLDVCTEGDQAIIYFSGHGDVDIKTADQPAYLLAYDTPIEFYMSNAIDLKHVKSIFETLSFQKKAEVTLISDACHAGNLAGNSINGTQITAARLQSMNTQEAKVLSCQPSEYSLEGPQWGGGRGVFSFFLVLGLYGMADENQDGEVNLFELENYLQSTVPREVAPESQIPRVEGNLRKLVGVVDPGLLAEIKAKQVPALAIHHIEAKGLEATMLERADTSIQELYAQFQEALDQKHLMHLEHTSFDGPAAYDLYLVLSEKPKLKGLQNIMRRNLAVALQEEPQLAINGWLRSEPKETGSWNNGRWKDYLNFVVYLEKAAELLGPDHYIYNDLMAKAWFFKAREMVVRNGGASTPWKPEVQQTFYNTLLTGLEYKPDAPYLWFKLSYYYYNIGDLNKEREALVTCIEYAPNWAHAYQFLGWNHFEQGDFDQALQWFKKAELIDPMHYNAMEKMALAYHESCDWKNAELYYKKALEEKGTLDDYSNLGWANLKQGDIEEAEFYLQKAIELDPEGTLLTTSRSFFALGEIAKQRGDIEKAESYWKIGFDGMYSNVRWFIMDFYGGIRCGYYKEAAEFLRIGIRFHPENASLHYHLGLLLTGYLDQKEEGIEELEKAIQLDPADYEPYYKLAVVFADQQEKEEAISHLEKALNLNPDLLDRIEQGPSFESLQETEEFQRLMLQYLKKE